MRCHEPSNKLGSRDCRVSVLVLVLVPVPEEGLGLELKEMGGESA